MPRRQRLAEEGDAEQDGADRDQEGHQQQVDLAFCLALADAVGQAMPVTAAAVTVIETLWGRGLRANPLLDGLDLADLPAALGQA